MKSGLRGKSADMSRFYAPKENVKGDSIYIDGDEARHILNVMRLGEKDKVVVFDGTGREYTGFVKKVKAKSLIVEIISTKTPMQDTLPEITLAQALPKKGKMDYIVEKATELGVRRIAPVLSERTVVKIEPEKMGEKTDRWQKIARETAKQCGRTDIPEVKAPEKFYNAIDAVNEFDMALVACLSEDTIRLKSAISDFKAGKIIVFIGPEGDFTPEEIAMAGNTSCKLVSLGSRVLKSDTAGLFALSILNYEFSR